MTALSEWRRSPGWTYFIQNEEGYIKIGRTLRDPQVRLRELEREYGQGLRIAALFPGVNREREFHDYYRLGNVQGEWFVAEVLDDALGSWGW